MSTPPNPIERMRNSGNQAGYIIVRTLFIDAVCGVEIPGRWFDHLSDIGLIWFYAGSESYVWLRKQVETLDDVNLYKLYTQLRHGASIDLDKVFASQ